MSIIKCKDCEKEISIKSKQCIYCGSNKPFQGYRFKRKELVSMGLSGYSDFKNFIDRGGKVGSAIWGKIAKVFLWCVFGYFVIMALSDDVKQTEKYYEQHPEQVKVR